ncbi:MULTISPECIES: hypothetical protein [unclassified Luteimonas]
MKIHPAIATSIAAASLALCSPAQAQSVYFMSAPLSNACNYPNVVSLLPPPAIDIAPQAARVVTKSVSVFRSPHGLYIADRDYEIHPGALCYFHGCTAQVILLTCATPGAAGLKQTTNVRLERKED